MYVFLGDDNRWQSDADMIACRLYQRRVRDSAYPVTESIL